MSANRTFDYAFFYKRRQDLVNSRNQYLNNVNGQRIIYNTQLSDWNASRQATFAEGATTMVFRGTYGNGEIISPGGIINIPPYPQEPEVVSTAPSAPIITSIDSGNQELTVNFTPPTSNGGAAITNYEFSTNGGTSFTSFSPEDITSPVVIIGLTNGTSYSVRIRAVNYVGSGAQSNAVSATPATTPSAPTITSITSGDQQLTVNFTAPISDGGSAITNYEYSTNGGTSFTPFSPADTTSPVVITGLTNGTSYSVRIRAVNSINSGAQSNAISATPSAPTPGADSIIASLTTSLAAYNAAANDDWVKITPTEWAALQTNVTGTLKAGASDTILSGTGSGLSQTGAAFVANSAQGASPTGNSPAILANQYLYGFAFNWALNQSTENISVYTNNTTANGTGFNQVGSLLPNTSSIGIAYYVRKGVSTTNGSTSGLLAFFTGSKINYSGTGSFTGSAGFVRFATPILAGAPTMRYLIDADGIVPPSPVTLSSALPNYSAFAIQGLTTATKQWA